VTFDYGAEYDSFWLANGFVAAAGTEETNALAEEVVLACGGGRSLDVGAGTGSLVRALLALGVEAEGVDVSGVAVEYASRLAPNRFVRGSVLKLPFDDAQFDTVIAVYSLEHLASDDVPRALLELRRVTRRNVYVRIATVADEIGGRRRTLQTRAWWENQFLAAGFRKHAAYYRLNDYESLEQDAGSIPILLERVPDRALSVYPAEVLARERDLHMDMLRETGARADAHVARYQWATRFVRPGDTVLDAACGLGYGSYVLQTGSSALRTVGVDSSRFAVEYAAANFCLEAHALEFRLGLLPDALVELPDQSFDVIVSFETLEHVEDPRGVLREFHRLLTPGGRVVCSVPNDWSDESGRDPNPFHLHTYTLDSLLEQLGESFLIEHVFAQSATRHKTQQAGRAVWVPATRTLRRVTVGQGSSRRVPDAEWWLAASIRSPFDGDTTSYRETTYPTFGDYQWNVTAFKRDYRNPWPAP